MTDLSKLSNEELMQVFAQQEQARRAVSGMSDQDLKYAAFQPPKPPPGVTIHYGGDKGDRYVTGKGEVPATPQETEARYLRERNGVAGEVGDAVLRGVPYAGAFFPRARAAYNSATPQEYAKNLSLEQARAKTFDSDYPVSALGAKATGAIGGTVAAMGAGRALGAAGVPVLPSMINMGLGVGAGSVPGAIMRGGIAGGLQGATEGVGESADLTNRNDVLKNAATTGGFGAAFGALVPAAIAGGSAAKNALMESLRPDALTAVPKPAREWMVGELGDRAKVAAVRQRMDDLGPNAMMLDASPEMAGVAQGASVTPGTRQMIVDKLNARDAGKNARIGAVVGAEIGPDAPPSIIKAQIDEAKRALGPSYEAAFANTQQALDTAPIAKALGDLASGKRGPAQEAALKVREMLAFPGSNVLDGSPRTLHQVRMAIDGMMDGELNKDVLRTLQLARTAIDTEMAAKIPGIKPLDSRFAELSREWDAFKTGQQAFDVGRSNVLRPSELAETQRQLVQPAGTASGPPTSGGLERLSQGARSEIERIVGTKANDVAALNQLLRGEGDWNRDKLRLLFGQDKADRILRTLDAERTFEASRNNVVGNSMTAVRQSYGEMLGDIRKPLSVQADRSVSLTGLGIDYGKKLVRALSGSNNEEKAKEVATALSRLSVADRQQVQPILDALLTRGQRQQTAKTVVSSSGGAGAALSGPAQALMEALSR